MKDLAIALAGNPNSGKSTVFNELTGSHQHVGNWPGKTVEKKEGHFQHQDFNFTVVDLPGTYSLTAYSQEEKIARDFIIERKPDAVISIVDAANLERNLYLTLQVLELGVPVILVLNMMDLARQNQLSIDEDKLSAALNVPVVAMTAREGKGFEALKNAIFDIANQREVKRPALSYTSTIDELISRLSEVAVQTSGLAQSYNPRWLAIKLLEKDTDILDRLNNDSGQALIDSAEEISKPFLKDAEFSFETQMAESRYQFIHQVIQDVVQRPKQRVESPSDKIDRIVTNRFLGIPIFLALMWIVFKLTTDVADPFLRWVEGVIGGPLTHWVIAILGILGLSGSWVESLLVDGIIAGVGGVLVFFPVMMMLYLALALLEDSGYMARAAFVMDRLMKGVGLHGKSFLPMIVGFGCTVPAIYATRTLENERDRILTGLLVPFMSCGARLPVYVLFAEIFFPDNASLVIFSLYLTGVVVAILLGIVLKKTLFKTNEVSPFVMELPPYRLPTFKGIWAHMWERSSHFIKRAWTLIMATSIVIWVLLALPVKGGGSFANTRIDESAFSAASSIVSPVFAPAGFGSWQASGSLITGFVAKEVVVSTISQVYGVEESSEEAESAPTFIEDASFIVTSFFTSTWDAVRSIPLVVGIDLFDEEPEEEESLALMTAVQNGFEESSGGHGKLAAAGFLLFTLLYTPCMVAVAAARQEFGSRIMWYSILGQLVLAWVVAVLVFQLGLLFNIG